MLSRLNIYRIKNETGKRKEEEEEKMQKTRLIIFVVGRGSSCHCVYFSAASSCRAELIFIAKAAAMACQENCMETHGGEETHGKSHEVPRAHTARGN